MDTARRSGGRKEHSIVSDFCVQPRRSELAPGSHTLISRLWAAIFDRRHRKPSAQRLSDHLLRDAGLERIGGTIRRRLR